MTDPKQPGVLIASTALSGYTGESVFPQTDPQTSPAVLSEQEIALQRKWLDEYVEPHFDNGGRASQANAVALFSALKQCHATITDLQAKLAAAEAERDDFRGTIQTISAKYNCDMTDMQARAEAAEAALEKAREALLCTGLGTIVFTDVVDGHDWVCHSDDASVEWCQWCGVHKVEVPNWQEHPQCEAFHATAAALSPASSSTGASK